MARYAAGIVTADSIAAVDAVGAELWNPHSTISLYVAQVSYFTAQATNAHSAVLLRSTAKGTFATTVTPDIDNHFDRRFAPISGALLYTSFSVEPTIQLPHIRQTGCAYATHGSGFSWEFEDGLEVPAGTGLCIAAIYDPTDLISLPVGDATFMWDE